MSQFTKARRGKPATRPKGGKTNSCGKVRYETSGGAEAAAILQRDRTGTRLAPYFHPQCLGWHLTSKMR